MEDRLKIHDAELLGLVADRRLLLRQLSEVIARKGPSTPNRNAVNRERTERRKALKKAIRTNEFLTATRVSQMVPYPKED